MRCSQISCTALLREDLDFRRHMEAYNLPQRRFVCHAGHSLTLGVPVPTASPRPLPTRRPTGPLHAHECQWCGEAFEGKALQKYCSLDCSRAVDRERTRRRNAADPSRLSPADLARVRAIPFGRCGPAPAPPIPDVPRVPRLSKAWM